MPTLVGAVIDSMLVALDDPVSKQSSSNTRAEPVRSPWRCGATPPSRLPTSSWLTASDASGTSSKRWRPRSSRRTPRVLDPYGMTVRDIDTPADLG